jgi:L-ascorbate metabolism protein UlaG (beta-lactamase superfamily)
VIYSARMRRLSIASIVSTLALALTTLAAPAAHAAAGATTLTWYGHAAFKLTTPSGKVVLIDPWISNPSNKSGAQEVAALDKADLILISHGHFDHVGDAVAIAKKTGARLVATFDLGNALVKDGGFPAKQFGMDTGGNFGGELALLDGEVTVTFVPAVHSSSVTSGAGTPAEQAHWGGAPGGFLISVKNGPTLYHTGDTDLFGDMALVGKQHKVTLMLACIGGHFTMGPERAAEAVKLVNPAAVAPMHFGTFPALAGTPDAFGKALKAAHVKSELKVLSIGEPIKL